MQKLLLKYLLEDLMRELLVSGDVKTAQYLVAYKEKVWLLPSEDVPPRTAVEISKALNILPTFDVHGIRDHAEENLDVVIGSLNNRILYIYGAGSLTLDPKTSLILKKIVHQLKLKGVERAADDSTELTKKSKIKGALPDVVYHGTSSKYLRKILSTGLRPGESESNYPKVISHQDLVFFTSRPEEAKYHAVHTADKRQNNVKEHMDIPVILEMSIPDPAKLVADYDVAALSAEEKPLSKVGYWALQNKKIPRQQSQETGIWGYRGRVSANFIKYVYIPKDWPNLAGTDKIHYLEMKDYKKMRPQAALKYIEKLEEYGY